MMQGLRFLLLLMPCVTCWSTSRRISLRGLKKASDSLTPSELSLALARERRTHDARTPPSSAPHAMCDLLEHLSSYLRAWFQHGFRFT